jgi:hypothetical protein
MTESKLTKKLSSIPPGRCIHTAKESKPCQTRTTQFRLSDYRPKSKAVPRAVAEVQQHL